MTFPRSVGQVPIYYNHKNTGRPADAANKYTSKYLDLPWTPLYPFGYGLSYTTFKVSALQLTQACIPTSGRVSVRAQVENTGSRAGDEVIQLYLSRVGASVTRPVRELKAFQRVSLEPGEKKVVEFTLGPEHLGFYNGKMRYVVEPGFVKLFVGTSSEATLNASLELRVH